MRGHVWTLVSILLATTILLILGYGAAGHHLMRWQLQALGISNIDIDTIDLFARKERSATGLRYDEMLLFTDGYIWAIRYGIHTKTEYYDTLGTVLEGKEEIVGRITWSYLSWRYHDTFHETKRFPRESERYGTLTPKWMSH